MERQEKTGKGKTVKGKGERRIKRKVEKENGRERRKGELKRRKAEYKHSK